ncbi:MAG: DNA-binding transcriptional regulator, MarR family [Klenkia sp.]|nr:DNA-binding transcriptional regulator, MarR family [Klenkia sp.]
MDRSTITVQLRRLEERGLVVRTPDPDDGRVVLLTAGAAGERVRAAVVEHGAQAGQSVMTGWTATDRRRFAALFDSSTAGMDPAPPRR